MQGGGAVWRRGGVDGRPGKDLHFGLQPRDGLVESGRCLLERAHKALSLDLARESAMVVTGAQGPI
jgi:hypothetical protein